MTDTEKGAMTLEEYGDKLINDDLGKLVESNPYFAFIVLASAIEFIARCNNCRESQDIHHAKRISKKVYLKAINTLKSFKKYRQLKEKNGNKLYTLLRCGLVHTTMPNKGITLSSEKNELQNNVVGCMSLYEDVKNAWAEIKADPSILQYLQTNNGLVISEDLPITTPSSES